MNRVIGRRAAIVEEQPGVTRDRKEFAADWQGRQFSLVDTGGWLAAGDVGLTGEETDLAAKVSKQADAAMKDADVIVLVVDVTTGVTEEDARVARVLQRSPHPVIVAVNKVDDERREAEAWAFSALGLGDPVPVSALHGRLSGELLDAVVAALPPEPEAPEVDETDDGIFSIAIVGRPNVGKSTLFNRIVGEERSVVHDLPGTTRDAIDTIVETPDGPLRFVDTAGPAPQEPDRRGDRVLQPRAGAGGDRPGRRRAVPHRCHRGCHPPGSAPGRAGRRGRHGDRARAQQVGPARHRAAGRRAPPARGQARVPHRTRLRSRSRR